MTVTDDLAECNGCDTQWIGDGCWDAAFAHMHGTHHSLTITGTI